MSDNKESSEGTVKTNSGEVQEKVELSEVLKRLEELESTNKRLLEESKGYKKQATDYKSKLELFEKKKVEESGDISAKLELELKEKEKLLSENKTLRAKTLKNNIRAAISNVAKDVYDMDDFLNQPKFVSILEDGIDGENLTVSEEAAKTYANAVLKEKPWMKRNSSQEEVDATRPNVKETTKNVASKSYDELKEELKKQIIQTKL
jgi:hypothetical protein